MAKQLLLNVLVQVLGDFIEGITEENLKVGVWSGKIELRNLQLHRAGIDKLKLPVSVVNGFVGSITVSIPWSALASQPVKIFIDGVNLLLGPLDSSDLHPEEAYERNIAMNKTKLDQAEKAVELVAQMTEQDDPKAATYFQNLTTQILDNLEIRISNIHIRYEDSKTFPNATFAYGITLHNFFVTTTNEHWQDQFVAREGKSLVHKLGTIENLVVYWNTHSVELSHLAFDPWMKEMNKLIYSPSRADELSHMNYIVAPPNTLSVKLIHNDAPGAVPRVKASLESMDLVLNIDKLQYHQIMQTLDACSTIEVRQRLIAHRPRASAKVCPQAWWKYAAVLLTQNEHLFSDKVRLQHECAQYRSRYIQLVSKRKLLTPALVCESLSEDEIAEMDRIERILPLDALLLYREIAIKKTIVHNQHTKKAAAKAATAKKASKSWFGGWGSSKSKAASASSLEAEQDVSLEDLQRDLEQAMTAHLVDMGSFTVDFSFVSSTLLSVTSSGQPIAQLRMGLSADCTLRGEGLHADVQMTDLLVTDEFTPSPVFKNLIAVRNSGSMNSSPGSPFSVSFNNSNGKIRIGINALPLQVCMNKFCVQQILSVVQVPQTLSSVSEMRALQNTYAVAMAGKGHFVKQAGDNQSTATSAFYALGANNPLLAHFDNSQAIGQSEGKHEHEHEQSLGVQSSVSSIEITLEADAPKIVIPEDSCNDLGFLLMDTGHLSIKGQMGTSGMRWNVKLTDINAALPRCARDLYTVGGENSMYLIRPFGIAVGVQTIDKSVADMTVSINVQPNIRGELSADKLSRLMHIIDIVPSTFQTLPSDESDATNAISNDFVVPQPTALTIIDTRQVNPLQCEILLHAVIPEVSLHLQYGSHANERNLLCISGLSTDITMRPYDMQVLFDLGTLSIEDFMREESQVTLARTPAEGQQSLVHFSYTKINHVKSPLYTQYGTEIEVKFGKLYMNADANTLLHLRPCYEIILGKRLVDYPPELMSIPAAAALSQQTSKTASSSTATTSLLEYVPTKMHVTVTLQTISLELLKADSEMASHSPESRLLDSVVLLDISGLTAEVIMGKRLTTTCAMQSLRIMDTRYLSSEYHFKTILGPTAVQLAPVVEEETLEMERESSIEMLALERQDSTPHNLFTLTYSEDSDHDKSVRINIGPITSYLSLDTILDLVNIATVNAMAVVELTGPVDTEANKPTLEPGLGDSNPEAVVIQSDQNGPTLGFSIHITMQGARVILLEDPTEKNTRAICQRLGLDLHYHTLTTDNGCHKSVEDALHCAITEVETYVIIDMERNRPHQIMDPLSLLINYKKTTERDVPLTTHITVGIDGLHTRFSLADIMLVQSILLRRTVVDSSPAPVADTQTQEAISNSGAVPGVQHLTLYQIKVNVGSMCAIVVNDFEGKNVPIIRLAMEDTVFEADGFLKDMQGGGSMVLKADAYNNEVTEWEPLLDRWQPNLKISSDSTDLKLGVESQDPVQLSITSTFLQSVSRTLSLWELMNQHGGEERSAIPSLTFSNKLGVPVEVVSTSTGESLFVLENNYDGEIFLSHRSTGDVIPDIPNRVFEILSNLPSAVDIHFRSPEMSDRCPLTGVPVTSVARQKYGIASRAESALNRVHVEPVIEAVYEYQRYTPLRGGWINPFLMGDPPHWSNARGTKELKRNQVTLPNASWEWVGDWAIDKSGKIRKEIDDEGWDYALNFSYFTPTSARRGEPQTMDCARRRKWIRTRVPVSNSDNTSLQSLALFWDVLVLDDGSKVITLRSCLEIENQLPYSVVMSLSSNQWREAIEVGPLQPKQVLCVPLLHSTAEYVRFKGADIPTDWTVPVPCGVRPLDFQTQAEIACTEGIEGRMLHIRPVIKQAKKSLRVSLFPHMSLFNSIPCCIGYKFFISGASKKDTSNLLLAEEGQLEAGAACSLSHVKVSHNIHVSVHIGDFGWSDVSDCIISKGSTSSRVNLHFSGPNGQVTLILRLRIKQHSDKPFEIVLFSKDALINYTGLDISVNAIIQKGSSNRVRRSTGGTYNTELAGVMVSDSAPAPVYSPAVSIDNFVVRSRRRYNVTRCNKGSFVHTDRNHRFTFLPPVLSEQTFISTPCNDRDLRLDGSNMIQFTITTSSIVLVLLDKRVESPPAWLKAKSFYPTILHSTSCGLHEGVLMEIHYAVYGRVYSAGDRVALGSNHSADARDMYTVFVVSASEGPGISNLREQVSSTPSERNRLAERSWCSGDNGIVLFNSENGKISVSVNGGRASSSSDITLKILPSEKGPFEIVDRESNIGWQLAYSVVPMPGVFKRTKVVSIIPRYCIANCMDQALEIRQKGTKKAITVQPFTSQGWHKSHASGTSEVFFRSPSSSWSKGALDINELGTYEVMLPTIQLEGSENSPPYIVVNVEVKIASTDAHCAVSITFWRSDPELGSPLSIRNDSSAPLYARQAEITYSTEQASQFQMVVPPGGWLPFGWAEPDGAKMVQISVGDPIDRMSTKSKILPFMASKKKVGLSFSGSVQGKAIVSVETRLGGAILCITDATSNDSETPVRRNASDESIGRFSEVSGSDGQDLTNVPMSTWISLQLAFVGISVVADKPERREFLSLYAENTNIVYGMVPATNMQSVEVKIQDLQIDNYSETTVYPVLLRRVEQKGDKKAGEEVLPFFQFAVIRETTAGVPPSVQYRYITMRVIEFALEVDSSTIELLLTDVLSEFNVETAAEALARAQPEQWISGYNSQILSPIHRIKLVDIFKCHMEAKASKIYFESIVIHPMKVALTFVPTKSPDREESKTDSIGAAVLDILTSMVAVELMEIRINSFIVKDAIESIGSLQTRIRGKLYLDLMHQLAQIAGSLTVLGSPAGLARNVGSGVQDFFYEPYQGLVQSPQDFLIGIQRGTSSLLAGVVGGALNSTVAIVGTASSGFAYLTGDSEYVQQRATARQKAKVAARDQGMMGGFKQGGKEVLSGFTSGVTGIFTQPMEQMKKDGAIGLFTGLGKGVAGVAVKPILGLTDGLTTIVSSITSEVNDTAFASQKRQPRTFHRQVNNPEVLVLSPLNLSAVAAQAFVMTKAAKAEIKDRYVANCAMTSTAFLILSEKFLYFLPDGSQNFKYRWSEVSQVNLNGDRVEFYLYEDSSNRRPIVMRCSNEKTAEKCYALMFENAHRLSNPSCVRSLEVIRREKASATSGSIEGSSTQDYSFGMANYSDIKHQKLSEKDIYKSLKNSLKMIRHDNSTDNEVWSEIDNAVWSSLFLWSSNHTGLSSSRALALIVINSSTSTIQLNQFDLKRGKAVAIFGTSLFERGSKTIMPRGCVVIFVCALPPNLYDSGHILLDVESTAFELNVASRPNKTNCKGKDVFQCAFLEKSSTEWWSKYTVKIY